MNTNTASLATLSAALLATTALSSAQPVLTPFERDGIEVGMDRDFLGNISINGVPVHDTTFNTIAGGYSLSSELSGSGGIGSDVTTGEGYGSLSVSRSNRNAEMGVTTMIRGPYEENGQVVPDTAVVEHTIAYTNLNTAADQVNIYWQTFGSEFLFGADDIRAFNANTGTPYLAANGKFWAITADDTDPDIDLAWEITDLSTQVLDFDQANFDGLTNSVEPVGSQILLGLRRDNIAFGETVVFRFRHLFAVNGALTEAPDAFDFTPAPPVLPGCNVADLAEPFGVLDLTDIYRFTADFLRGCD